MRNCKGERWQAWLGIPRFSDRYSRSTWERGNLRISARGTWLILDGRFLRLSVAHTSSACFSLIAGLFVIGALAPKSNAEQILVDLDQAKTQVAFTLNDVLHTVHGKFRLKEGHFSFDPDATPMSGDIVVDAASGESGSGARDRRMTRNILQAADFPEIRFSPGRKTGPVALTGQSDVNVTGSFLIHGETHEITVPFHVEISGDEVIAKGTFMVPYVEWGMKNPSNFLFKVNDKVEIELTAVGHLKPAKVSSR
jgi:polyisoprenoid-binding protein YceI